jgi:predicted transcriptional regulator
MLFFQHKVMGRESKKIPFHKLSRRERQVMDILYSRGHATAAEIHEALPDPPTFSATRAVIRTLEEKAHVRHQEQGLRYIYIPVVPLEKARSSALTHFVSTFFEGSPTRLMAALLDQRSLKISDEELKSLESLIRKAKEGSK